MISPISIREAGSEDIPRLIEMGIAMQAESIVSFPEVDPEHTDRQLRALMAHDDGCVLVTEPVVGALVAMRAGSVYSPVKTAGVSYLFVEPEHRNIRVLRDLLKRYEEWAGDVFSKGVGVSTGLDMERLMRVFGYRPTGHNFRKI